MSFLTRTVAHSWALAALLVLLAVGPVAAQGSVTPAFGDGTLTLVGEGYRPAERVEITVRVGGASHPFTATADARGRFRLATGLAVQPLASIEIAARDEQGVTQVTRVSVPGGSPGAPAGGAPSVPATPGGTPPAPATVGGAPVPATSGGVPMPATPTRLPRTGGPLPLASIPLAPALGALALVLGYTLRRLHR